MDRTDAIQPLAAAVVASLGLLLASIFTFDVYQDVVIGGDRLWFTLLENSVPYLLSAAIVAVGLWLGTVPDRIRSTTVLRWTVASLAAVLILAAWVYLFQRQQGRINPRIIAAQLSAAAILGGIVVGIYSDRQRRRREELAVEKSRLEALFENTSEPVTQIAFEDDEPIVIDANPAFESTFGYEAREARERSFDELFPESRSSEALSEFRDHARRGERYEVEIERRRSDGEIGTFVARFVPLDDADSPSDGFTVYTDITETRRYADRLDALHEATRDLLEAGTRSAVAERAVDAGAALLDLDVSGIYFRAEASDGPVLEPVAMTEGALETFESIPTFEPESSLAWDVYESGSLVHYGDVRTADRIHNPETPIRSELIVPLGDHGIFIAGSTEPEAFDETDVALAQILGANVRSALDGARREQELRAREHELAEQNARLEEFASIVSHDLRNPLQVAEGYLELAREERTTPAHGSDADGTEGANGADPLDQVDDALDRMGQLIDDLLQLARQGEAIGETESVPLADVVADAWAGVDDDGATLSIETHATVEADRDRLRQLLENLLANSVEHGSTNPRSRDREDAGREVDSEHSVSIVVGDLSNGEGFYVADDGPGIPDEEKDEVLEFGYTTDPDGTGFGLAIVSEIADAHGWSIAVTDSERGGARFEVSGVAPVE